MKLSILISTALLVVSLAAAPARADTYTECAPEGGTCTFSGMRTVRFGAPDRYVYRQLSSVASCFAVVFGRDPAPGSAKRCAFSDATFSPGSSAVRPASNRGTGFFVANSKLYDANGREFRIRGVNKVHWDNESVGLRRANSNTTRWIIDFRRAASDNVSLLQGSAGRSGTVATQNVVIPGNWDGTCKSDPAILRAIVDTWVAQAASWKQLERSMILNIANEWGPEDGAVWRDSYIEAIQRLRAAGYHATLSITAGGCGQDPFSIVHYGRAVFDADPEQNVIFDQHIYGAYQDTAGGAPGAYDDLRELGPQLSALASTGLVVVIGEFGPGRNVGPSPTEIRPERVIALAEQNGLGWLAWAWDDNNLAQGMSDENGFSMSVSGSYDVSADLTKFGRVVVEHPTLGLKALASRASIFP